MYYSKFEMVMKKNRVKESRYEYNISSSKDVYKFCTDILKMQEYPEERFIVIAVSSSGGIVGFCEVSKGDINSAAASPREVFRPVIGGMPATCIILAHNHPSGHSEPSSEDIRTTKRLVNAGELLGIKVIDHIIIGDGEYCSLKECGHIAV